MGLVALAARWRRPTASSSTWRSGPSSRSSTCPRASTTGGPRLFGLAGETSTRKLQVLRPPDRRRVQGRARSARRRARRPVPSPRRTRPSTRPNAYLKDVATIFAFSETDFERIAAATAWLQGRSLSDPQGGPEHERRRTKRHYRRLVAENHREIARGLPPEAVKIATERVAAINAAWERIAAERGMGDDMSALTPESPIAHEKCFRRPITRGAGRPASHHARPALHGHAGRRGPAMAMQSGLAVSLHYFVFGDRQYSRWCLRRAAPGMQAGPPGTGRPASIPAPSGSRSPIPAIRAACRLSRCANRRRRGACQDIVTRWHIRQHVLGHSDVAPGRKVDPGGSFPGSGCTRRGRPLESRPPAIATVAALRRPGHADQALRRCWSCTATA